MTRALTDEQIKPLIPQDMDWRYVVGEAGALEFAREVIKLDRANREKNYALLTAYAQQQHTETAEEMYARHVDAEEADDETIRKMLAVTKPALYGKHLRRPNDGPITSSTVEAEIAIAKQQFAIVAEALLGATPEQDRKPAPSPDSTGLALVDIYHHWRPIDASTKRGVKLQLINRTAGVATYGALGTDPGHWTHWAPLPTFKDRT